MDECAGLENRSLVYAGPWVRIPPPPPFLSQLKRTTRGGTLTRPLVKGITIDPPGARDLDDAIWVEETHNGFVIHVTVPDASRHVYRNSPSDKKARRQLTTFYGKGDPKYMLPREVVEGKLSLLAGQERNTLTISVFVDASLEAVSIADIRLTRLTSMAQLSYDDVPRIINDKGHELRDQLLKGTVIANALASLRRDTGSIGLLDLPNGWVTTEEGIPRKILADHHAGHVLVREFMVAVNALVASFCVEHGIPILYRNHPNGRFIDLSAWLDPHEGLPDLHDINAIREHFGTAKSKAIYGLVATGHDGLKLSAYTRMTSPIRRFVDLVVHRQLKAYLMNKAYPYTEAQLKGIKDSLNRRDLELGDEKPEMHRVWKPSDKIPEDFVTKLHNYAQATRIRPPKFTVQKLEGVDDDSRYVCICQFNGVKRTTSAGTPQAAKQAAAKAVYKRLRL